MLVCTHMLCGIIIIFECVDEPSMNLNVWCGGMSQQHLSPSGLKNIVARNAIYRYITSLIWCGETTVLPTAYSADHLIADDILCGGLGFECSGF